MAISLKKNIISNYIGQIYMMGISIIILPLFLKLLGSESYGIVAFYMMAQGWMAILDLGMSPTLSREIAANKNNKDKLSIFQLKSLIRSLEVIFLITSILVVVLSVFGSNYISLYWLTSKDISHNVINHAVILIGIIISIRWFCGLYRSGINGYEEQVWLNKINILFSTLKNPISLVLLYITDGNLLIFFYYQVIIAVIEILCISYKFHHLLPVVKKRVPLFSWSEIKRVKSFAGTTAFTACLWVFLTQFDKLLMSKYLTLEYFGYYSLVVSVSTGIMMLSGPISTAILPRLTSLYIEEKEKMVELYMNSTRFVSITVLPISLLIILMPYQVLLLWTDNQGAAIWGKELLSLYSIGALCVVYTAFLHYIQFAHGNLKYHLRYGVISAIIIIPSIYYAALHYSVYGVAVVWLARGLFGFIFWAPFIHSKFIPGIHLKWFFNNIILYAIVDTLIIFLFKYYFYQHLYNKYFQFSSFILVVVILLGFNFLIKKISDK
ncbi:oligosaccharide flippase family protein [Photobacterium kishitanii]|uniref:oligosaccharide flippase family protein n=1 Tax=Photobacterium kishitanii TaxID=318456 RepID=UPI0011B2098C|nr:oligosaccharide flippase family protein [Photobacterium kishitanii]